MVKCANFVAIVRAAVIVVATQSTLILDGPSYIDYLREGSWWTYLMNYQETICLYGRQQ